MEVISLGMPRTGTKSMQSALQILGYNKVYHGFVLVDEPLTSNLWEEAVDAKFYGKKPKCSKAMFDTIFDGYAASTDTPAAFFVEEMLSFYPDAKVILVERDVDKWLASFKVLMDGMFDFRGKFILGIDNILGYSGLRTYQKLYLAYFKASDAAGILANARDVYQEHYERVRRLVPSERLLEYKLGSGWEPLCTFLGKEKPDQEFPWVNEAAALQQKMISVMVTRFAELLLKYVWLLAPLSIGLVAVYVRMS